MTPTACKNSQGKVGLRGALPCWHSGLRAVTYVRVCSSQTRNLSLSFSELLVETCGVQNLERPGKPNSSRHATSPVTTEAWIIADAGRATLSQAPANSVLLLLSLVLLPVRSRPSARAEDLTRLRLCSWRFLSPYVRGMQILKSAVINWKMTLVRCQSFAHTSTVLLDTTSTIWNALA